jgi:hypothetical protein
MDASAFLALAGAVNRLVSVLKPTVGRLGLSDRAYDIALQLIAIVAGVILAFVAGGANVIPASLNVSPTIGVIITGVLVGLGSDVLNAVLEFLYAGQKAQGVPVVAAGGPTVIVPSPEPPDEH